MHMKKLMTIDYSVDAASGAYGIANIQNILGIICLVLSILSILYKMIYTIIVHIKDKKFDEISNELDEAKKKIEELEEGVKNE